MTKELIDAISDHVNLVQQVSYELNDLANAVYALGQDRLSESLAFIANALPKSALEVSRANSKAINDRLRESEQATVNMISAAIAGIEMSKEKDNYQN